MKLLDKYKKWREQRWFKNAGMLIKLAIAVLIIWVLLAKANISKESFADLDLRWIGAAFAAILLQNLLTGVRWWFLMRSIGGKSTLFEAVSLTMQGLFFTLFIPGGAVSGDVVKAALIAGNTANGGKFAAVFSVFGYAYREYPRLMSNGAISNLCRSFLYCAKNSLIARP